MTTRYVFVEQVVNVEEKWIVLRSYKNSEGDVIDEKESRGWFIRLFGSSAIGLGSEKPDIKAGDKIKFTIEKVS